jgi:hypothetical protein
MAEKSEIFQPEPPVSISFCLTLTPLCRGVTMRRTFALLSCFLLLLATVGGCQTAVPTFGRDTIMPALGFSAVPGQTEPELNDFDYD